MSDVTPDPIMRIALGFMAAKHLFVASAIGVFENWRAALRRWTRWNCLSYCSDFGL